MSSAASLDNGQFGRKTSATSRQLDFCTVKEQTAQTGYDLQDWPVYAIHELFDNALDACEECGVAPQVCLAVDKGCLEVRDNGPGIPPTTVEQVLDFNYRVSSAEVYVSPCRGAQGNALKTLEAGVPWAKT
jgi:signal transduction histidine kinase